jgi:hypothetical protein
MAHQIRKVEISEDLVNLTVQFTPAEGDRVIRMTPGAAEIWASEIAEAARLIRRRDLESTIASLRRQSQQIETMLRDAERRLAAGRPDPSSGWTSVAKAIKDFGVPAQ